MCTVDTKVRSVLHCVLYLFIEFIAHSDLRRARSLCYVHGEISTVILYQYTVCCTLSRGRAVHRKGWVISLCTVHVRVHIYI